MSGTECIKATESVINNSVVTNVPINQTNPSGHYLDLILHSQIANQLSNFNAKHGFNFTNISILLFMLSIGEIRSGMGEFYKGIKWGIKEYYKPFFGGIYNGLASFYKYITTPKPVFISKPKEYEFWKRDESYKEIVIELNPMIEFIQGLTNFLESKELVENITKKYEIKNEFDLKIENMEKEIQKEIWTDIEIQYKDIQINLLNELNLSFQLTHDKKKLTECNGGKLLSTVPDKKIIEPDKILYFGDLVNDPLIHDFLEQIHLYFCLNPNYTGYKSKNFQTTISIDEPEFINLSTFNGIAQSLHTNKNNIPTFIYSILTNLHAAEDNKEFIKKSFEFTILKILKYHYKNLILGPSFFQLLLYIVMIEKICDSDRLSSDKNLTCCNMLNSVERELILPGNIILKIPNNIDFSIKRLLINEINTSNINSITISGTCGLLDYLLHPDSIINKDVFLLCNKNNKLKKRELVLSNKLVWHIVGINFGSEKIMPNIKIGRIRKDDVSTDKNEQSNNNTKLRFECKSFNKSEGEIRDQFHEFMKYIKTMTFMSTNKDTKINVFRIYMAKDIKEELIDNPAYTEYEERKNQIKELTSTINSSHNSSSTKSKENDSLNISQQSVTNQNILASVMSEFIKIPIPPKKIKKEIVTKELNTELINETYKDFDTLYLRRSDENKLKSVLTKFNSKKELLKTLGLPNKLCVLLSGLPGVGKSSLIQVLGSYLKKDIYYLSFGGTIETNEDLQEVFDHVIHNGNQGIIVAEDIDAVGKLVHKREITFNEPNTVDLLDTKEEKLSLAYLLNLLQGTLTPDGLIFVATTNHYDKLDDAFTRDGRFDVKIDMKKCDRYQFQKMYQKFIGRNIPDELLMRISEDKYTPAQFIFHIKDFISEDYEDTVILERFLE